MTTDDHQRHSELRVPSRIRASIGPVARSHALFTRCCRIRQASQTLHVRAIACSGAGFLLAVLWFDLMFDVQARGHPEAEVPRDVRASIAAYYARVTTAARPMNRIVALAMVITVGALGAELVRNDLPVWRSTLSLVLTLVAVGLAARRTVPNAVRLGRQTDDPAQQSRLAHMIGRDHVICFGAIVVVLLLQLPPA